MSIVIEELILHVLDKQVSYPILSDSPMQIEEDISDYLTSVLSRTLETDDYKLCYFKEESKCFSLIKDQSLNFIEISKHIANEIFHIMQRNDSIPSGDLIVASICINGIRYFALVKLNYRNGYIHHHTSDCVKIIKQRTVLPTEKSTVEEAAIIDLENFTARITEKKYEIDGVKDYYLSTLVLECIPSVSERNKLKIIQKVTEAIIQESDSSKNLASEVASIIIAETNDDNKLTVRQISNKLDKTYPNKKPLFEQSVVQNGMDMDMEINVSNSSLKKMSKQALHTDSGVEIRIPLNSKDDIEFINNPDGTISILIKNIKFK